MMFNNICDVVQQFVEYILVKLIRFVLTLAYVCASENVRVCA